MSRLFFRYWFLLPLLLVVVIILDRIEEPTTVATEETINMSETQSDYYMAEFSTRKFDANGQLEYIVNGETLAHYPVDDRSEIVAPRIELHRPDAIWQIQSRSGRFDTDPNLFSLEGDVVVYRQREGSDPITIKTSSLTVATDTNIVNTNQAIEIVAPTWRLQATGLSSAIDDGKLALHSQVSGHYEVPNEQ
jgi:lipopolysaccharide export system protein LptC